MTQVGECACKNCQSACMVKPGWFAPNQIAPLAGQLGLTVQELFDRHLQVDWCERAGDTDIFALSPRDVGEDGGTMWGSDPAGTCHWYRDDRCAIHELGKPTECQQLGHGADGAIVAADHDETAELWNTPAAQQMIRDLYGEEPQSEAYHGDSLLSSLLSPFWR